MERPDPVPVVRVGRTDWHVSAGVAAVVVLVLMAVLKPWAPRDAAGAADRPPGASTALVTPSAIATASTPGAGAAGTSRPDGTVAGACWPSGSWRIVADERFLGRTVRAWVTADPVAARTPLDPAISVTRLVSGGILRFGFCAPVDAGVVPGRTWRATVWRIDPVIGTAASRSFTPVVRLLAPAGADGTIGPPPGTSRATAALWPPGRYVLEVHDAMTPYADAWFAVDLVTPAA